MAALKTMVEFGADLSVKDRWGNTIEDEAITCQSREVT